MRAAPHGKVHTGSAARIDPLAGGGYPAAPSRAAARDAAHDSVRPPSRMPAAGALVISLDFELHWGMRDHVRTDGPYRRNFLGVREVVPRLLALFEEFGVGATWATVGMLFARSREELQRFSPTRRARYADPRLDPYGEPVGDGEADDPFHYAPSLVARIREAPRQELATHTFSHYYCREPGQDAAAFAADLASAVAIAETWGVPLRSIVFPRNQHEPAYDGALRAAGIRCYRGTQAAWMHRATRAGETTAAVRAARYADAFVPLSGPCTTRWDALVQSSGLVDVPASFFLRPATGDWRDELQHRRIHGAMRHAARTGAICHLWWHPHNFGADVDANVAALRRLLERWRELRDATGMESLGMAEVAERALRAAGAGRAA